MSQCLFLVTLGLVAGDPLDALSRGLHFMEENISEINLDGVLGTRLVEEQLMAYLEFEPQMTFRYRDRLVALRDKAQRISDNGMRQVQLNDPEYTAALGHIMGKSKRLLWYPSRSTTRTAQVIPVPCAKSNFNETDSDFCLQEIVGTGSEDNPCRISEHCTQMMTSPRQRGYILTHQVLYWQLVEMRGCAEKIPESLQVSLCSNVMRDAQRIAEAKYPRNHRDLFMEQIGLCGMWSFKDFYKPEWLSTILSWQQPSGCFNDRAKWHCADHLEQTRIKRREKILGDGCLSHKTTVALLAITVSIRFKMEQDMELSKSPMDRIF